MAKAKKTGEIVIPTHILDDLCSRFIVNSDQMTHADYVFDLAEQAHWHYSDFYCMQIHPPPPKCSHKFFCKQIFLYLKEFHHLVPELDALYAEWQAKRQRTPSFGGIILSPEYTHVLMVQGFGSKTSWGFPKGKQEPRESGKECAIREIEEETSLEVSDRIREDLGIACWIQDRFHKLYIIPDVPVETDIHAKLRREIKAHKWIPVHFLPVHRNDPAPQQAGLDASQFFNVIPFVRPLRKWIEEQKTGGQQQAMPASQFTAKGRRRGKGKDTQRRQGGPGPDGDASASREGQGHSSRQSGVVRNLEEQFSDTGQSGQHVRILGREEGVGWSGGGQHDRDVDTGSVSATRSTPFGQRQLDLNQFHSKALLNFHFDTKSILDIFRW